MIREDSRCRFVPTLEFNCIIINGYACSNGEGKRDLRNVFLMFASKNDYSLFFLIVKTNKNDTF